MGENISTKSISLDNLDILHNKVLYTTNNDKYILAQEGQKIVNSPEFTILGFLNGYCYASASGSIIKCTMNGEVISRLYIEIEHGSFYEDLHFMYFYIDNIIYKIDENLNILWKKELDDNIKDISIDAYGSIYIIYMNSIIIKKFLNNGDLVLYLNESNDVTATCRLYNIFITKGCGYIYVIGTNFYKDNTVISFIDKYDVRKGKRLNREILDKSNNVKSDDSLYEYHNIIVDGDYIYIYAKEYIKKINLKMRVIWTHNLAYNQISKNINSLQKIEFDDTKYENHIYFVEDLYDTNGYGFGKLDTNGCKIWYIISDSNEEDMDFKLYTYKDELYISTKKQLSKKANYVLALDNDKVLFETTIEGQLIKLIEDNYAEMYSSENYNKYNLYGDKIKDNIPKIIEYSLMHNTGSIVLDEYDTILLLPEKNKDYTNPDNYDTFKLLSEDITEFENTETIIITKEGQEILTTNNSVFKTKEPYQGQDIYEFIVSTSGEKIDTLDDKDIVRLKNKYSNSSYLLADSHKFYENIITKKDEFVIITKKNGYSIMRKMRRVYKYTVQKLLDVDIIVEYLKQNGILDTLLPKYVDKLRHNTSHMIEDMQVAHIPTYYNINGLRKFSYTYDGYEYPIRYSGIQIWLCKNIPYIKKRENNPIFIKSMADLVDSEDITPFLIFINGKFVKWSDIIIVRDYFYSYLILNNIYEKDPILECIALPCNVRYGEDKNILPYDIPSFYFDENGYITDIKTEINSRIEIIDNDVDGNNFIPDKNKYVKVETEYNKLANHHNIIVFENNTLFGESRFYLQSYGNNIFKYLRNIDNIKFKTFYFNKSNDSKNMLNKLNNNIIEEEILDDIINDNHHEYIDNFNSQFDFNMSMKKDYNTNISKAVKYILTYDMSLLIDYYIDQNNINTITYTGEDLLNITPKNGGFLIMPRTRKNNLDDYIVVFRNNKLYEYYKEIEYNANTFKIPIFNHVNREDIFEIMHFKNVNNNYSTLKVTTNESDYIANNLRYDNFLLFANSYVGKPIYDDFNIENNIQYDVSFEYKNNFNDNGKYISTDISLDKPYYYGKELNITSKRQFHYMYYNVFNSTNIFKLDPNFRFCRNKNQYMIFVNGFKLNTDMWDLNIMNNSNIDLKYITITTVDMLQKNDTIEILYIPDPFEEIVIPEYNPELGFGDIEMNNLDMLNYSFDKNLFILFTSYENDKYKCGKINNANIQNISMNKLRLTNYNGKLYNLCICKYFRPDNLLSNIFSYGDTWSRSINNLDKNDFEKLLIKAKDKK